MPDTPEQLPESPSAQSAYAELMKGHIAPALRRLGYRGSGGAFTLTDAQNWVSIGFQRSSYSDRREVRFTANLTVASKADWEAARAERSYLPDRPAPSTFYGTFVWQSRIGLLTPGRRDTWWQVRPGGDLETLAHDVLAVIESYGLPAIRDRLAAHSTEPTSGDITAR